MNNKDFKKNFIENFKEENNLNISFEDTFNKELTENNNIFYNRYISLKKRHKLQTIFSCVLIMLLIVGMSIVLIRYNDYVGQKEKLFELTREENLYVISICDRIEETPIVIINYDGNVNLAIYKGVDNKDLNNNKFVYFYKIINYDTNIIIQLEDKEIYVTDKNLFGILYEYDCENVLIFKLIYENVIKEYKIS